MSHICKEWVPPGDLCKIERRALELGLKPETVELIHELREANKEFKAKKESLWR